VLKALSKDKDLLARFEAVDQHDVEIQLYDLAGRRIKRVVRLADGRIALHLANTVAGRYVVLASSAYDRVTESVAH
jgi:hypothetical protein